MGNHVRVLTLATLILIRREYLQMVSVPLAVKAYWQSCDAFEIFEASAITWRSVPCLRVLNSDEHRWHRTLCTDKYSMIRPCESSSAPDKVWQRCLVWSMLLWLGMPSDRGGCERLVRIS